MIRLVQFGAEWCNPCMRQRDLLTKEPLEGVDYQFIDTDEDENEELVEKYKIKVLPTLIILNDNGSVIWRGEGYHNRESLVELVEKLK